MKTRARKYKRLVPTEKPRSANQIPFSERLAFSPGEVAALLGKSQTFGYRLLYKGKIKAITGCGRLMIPRSEVELLLGNPTLHGQNQKG